MDRYTIKDNDICWCGSELKYCNCHKNFDLKLKEAKENGYLIPPRRFIKNLNQIEGIRKAGIINSGLLDYIESNIRPRMTTEEIDRLTVKYLKEHDSESADFMYEGYPKHLCTSVNDVICHGIPSDYVILNEGDIINVDATISHKGYFADASRMFMIGKVKPNAEKLVRVTKECLDFAVESIIPYKTTLNDLAKVIEVHAKKNGFSVVHEYCGHGVGLKMHEDPFVLHYQVKEKTYLIVPGMVFTIEPMINEGSRYLYLDYKDGWTARTKDKKLSAQWEYTILITEEGAEILSK
ncbi:methionyl aminopeptidase [bacterium]|nr:methionyl aminopeptidase [bacterium]